MNDIAITLHQVHKAFPEQEPLFKDLSFTVKKGEFVALIGPNGSGKTTLVKMLLRLAKPTAGDIHIYETRIGYVPQSIERDLFSPLTVYELFSLKDSSITFWGRRSFSRDKVHSYLQVTDAEKLIDRQVKHLSGGELQRVMIAYALIDNPGLLILDEPVSGVDVHGEHDFYEMIESIHREHNLTIIMISHDIDIVYRYASQVICLNKELICQGIPQDVLTKETIEKTFSSHHSVYKHQHK